MVQVGKPRSGNVSAAYNSAMAMAMAMATATATAYCNRNQTPVPRLALSVHGPGWHFSVGDVSVASEHVKPAVWA